MYFTEIDGEPFAIKPMNCPGGILVYKSDIHSYRELPMRVGELGFVHRHERSGALHGLMRVRAFTQDDAHIFCTPEQIKDEIKAIMDIDRYFYQDVFGFKYHVELSTRPEDSMGDPELWELAERCLKEALEETGTEYKLNPGDGAFYGPKIDFHLEDCIGRTWQCGTIQLDFQMPEKFDMTYIGKDGAEHRPVMLHRTVLGSLERFMGILIENYAGAFPQGRREAPRSGHPRRDRRARRKARQKNPRRAAPESPLHARNRRERGRERHARRPRALQRRHGHDDLRGIPRADKDGV